MKTLSIEAIEAILWSLTALDILLTAGRFLIHWRIAKKIKLDDTFNGIALVFLLTFMITWQRFMPIELPEQLYDAGITTTPPTAVYDRLDAMRNDFANLVVFWCTLYSVKASFLALYWQIFGVSRRFRMAWTVVAAYIILSGLITILSVFWHCGNPSTLMNPAACSRSKPRAITILYIGAVMHIVGDVLLMLLPTVMISKLQMRRNEKIGLAVVFALVLLDICFTVLRVVFTLSSVFTKVADENTLWVSLDPIIAVLVCTLPCYRNLVPYKRQKPISYGSRLRSISTTDGKQGMQSSYTEVDDLSIDQLPTTVRLA